MSAECLIKPSFADISGAAEINVKKFSIGDNVTFKNYLGVTMKVIGYIRETRSNEERVDVCWFNRELSLVEAAVPESMLETASEQDEKEYSDAFAG